MSVIIRLQNLPWAANAADIRGYFNGLSIPEGGVHIVGGEQGDAFIAFSTDEDARQAMLLDGGKLKEVKIKLLLSSRTEMLRVIEQARQQTLSVQNIIHGAVVTTCAPAITTPTMINTLANNLIPPPLVMSIPMKVDELKDVEKAERKDRNRSVSRERGRSRTNDSKDRSRDSRDRSRGRYRDRRRRDRSRSRDRYRRRSRSRDRRRSRDRDRDDTSRSKRKDSKESDDIEKTIPQNNKSEESPWEDQPKVPLLPDPPAMPPILMQMQQTGKDIVVPPAPILSFRPPEQERQQQPPPHFPFNPQMIPPQAYMSMPNVMPNAMPNTMPNAMPNTMPNTMSNTMSNTMANTMPNVRGREGWPTSVGPPVMGMMDPMQIGMQRPMMNNVDMSMLPPGFALNPPMFQMNPSGNSNDSNMMWRPPMMGIPDEIKLVDPDTDMCVEIRGLPLNASYIEVKKLFDGLLIPPDGIKMINDNHGNRTGIAYVRFSINTHKKVSINQNGKKVRSNIVEVIHLKDSIYKTAIDNFKPDKDTSLNSVDMDIDSGDNNEETWQRETKTRPRTKPLDPRIKGNERMSDRNMERNDRNMDKHVVRNNDRIVDRFTDRYIPRNVDKDNERHMEKNIDRHLDRGIDRNIDRGVDRNVERGIDRNAERGIDRNVERGILGKDRDHERIMVRDVENEEKRSDCVIIQGIPLQANENDVLDFFEELDIVPINTQIVRDGMGHPSGTAFCSFKNFEEADKALVKNNASMGRLMVTIKKARKEDMERSRQIQQGGSMWPFPPRPIMAQRPPLLASTYLERPPERDPADRYRREFGERERFPSDRGNEDRMGRFRGGDNGVPSMSRDRGGPMRGGRPRNNGRWDNGGDNPANRRGSPPQRRGGGIPRRGHSGGPGGPREPPTPYIDDSTLEQFGRPGCVVSLENLHFRAEIDEIIDFFEGFNIEHENVIRRFDDIGRPTGDARVSLSSAAEAIRAVRVLNFKLLKGRTVNVSLLQ